MLDLLLELGGDLIEGITDFFSGDSIAEVLGTGLLITGAIMVTELTVDTIQSELKRRQELKGKGVTQAIITDFVRSNGYTEISLAALNAKNQQVGTVKMKARSSSGIKKGDKIRL